MTPGNGHYDRGIEQRLSRVENELRDVKDTLAEMTVMMARIDAVMPHLATKAGVAKLESGLSAMDTRLDVTLPHLATKADLAEKPGKLYMWGILGVLLAAYACGLAALAVLK